MIRVAVEMRRLSHSLMTRGTIIFVLGLSAIIWPEECLVPALMGVGIVAVLFGLFEVAIAAAIRRRAAQWWLVFTHGLAAVAFGFLTVGTATPKLEIALVFVAAWLASYAAIAWRAATLSGAFPGAARALSVCASVDALLAIIVLSYGATTIFALLYFGAVYAAAFGAWQMAVGFGLDRLLRAHQGRRYGGVIITARI